jgi:hypothetical protein
MGKIVTPARRKRPDWMSLALYPFISHRRSIALRQLPRNPSNCAP